MSEVIISVFIAFFAILIMAIVLAYTIGNSP